MAVRGNTPHAGVLVCCPDRWWPGAHSQQYCMPPGLPSLAPHSIQLVKWPKSMQLQLFEQGSLRDTQVAEVFLAVPGQGGGPPRDPQPRPYSWTCPVAVPQYKLVKAAVLADAGGGHICC